MKITEPGYYWYRSNGSLVSQIVQVDKGYGFHHGQLVVWFFGNSVEITLFSAEKEGTFLRKIKEY